ncbi:MAG TPA: four helix bundle protein [Acidobacteriaceae bacterium]|nr:four helix bundle protein [Acidobacteriaceae bacterium]
MVQSAFRSSIMWQKAMTLSTSTYSATRKFPREEIFGLTNQLRPASVSIPSNIAEGNRGITKGEFIQFLGIARGSTLEVQTQLELASRLGYGDNEELESVQAISLEVLKLLNASISTLQATIHKRTKLC